jgi:hypothetical protein
MDPGAVCSVQIVVDCQDPHVLADWWAGTLGWHVEAQDEEFIRSMITQGHASENETRGYQGRLVDRGATVAGHGRQGPHFWVTITDIGGNEFCV